MPEPLCYFFLHCPTQMIYRFICVCCCLASYIVTPVGLFSQPVSEICDNALDDDGDGRIDLNDADCNCELIQPESLIPNPSFEEKTCCPNNRSQMSCADTWVQASEATTDFLHTCDWVGWEGLEAPLPFPDGEGCMGFRNGRYDNAAYNPNWKEYAGACLLEPLKAGISYKFRFDIGFTSGSNSPPTDIAFFGATECASIPFGSGDDEFGCPTNGPGWQLLGKVGVSGAREWKVAEINVTPTQDINAIAIGPDCIQLQSQVSIYYFFDNLVLDEAVAFDFQIKASDQLCAADVFLSVPDLDSLDYQWYKGGVALLGETGSVLSRIYGDGAYQVRFSGPDGTCRVTDMFDFTRPVSTAALDITICEDETYWFADSWLEESGTYLDTLRTRENCDSIVELELDVFVNRPTRTRVKLWPGEQYFIGPARLSNPGWHEIQMFSQSGCDSTVIIELEFLEFFAPNAFSPNDDGINDRYFIVGGNDVEAIVDLQIFNRWGRQVYQGGGQEPGSGWDGRVKGAPAQEGVYVYKAQVLFVDGNIREHTGSLTLVR